MTLDKDDLFPKPNSVSNKGKVCFFVMIFAAIGFIAIHFGPKIALAMKASSKDGTIHPDTRPQDAPDTPLRRIDSSSSENKKWKDKPDFINQNQSPSAQLDKMGNQDIASIRHSIAQQGNGNSDSQVLSSKLDPSGVNEKLTAQQDKENADDAEDYLNSQKKFAKSPYELKAGAVIPATLDTGLNSDLPGYANAVVRQNVYDTVTGSYLLIPKGTKVFGKYESKVSYGQQRLFIQWNRLIFSDGSSLSLKGMMGTSKEGASGFNDIVDNHIGSLISGAIMMTIIGTGAQLSQPQNVATGGALSQNQTIGQTMASQVGNQITEIAGKVVEKNMNIQPTITIRPGYEFNVMVNKDIVLEPISESN